MMLVENPTKTSTGEFLAQDTYENEEMSRQARHIIVYKYLSLFAYIGHVIERIL